jgi:D-glycero-D-manno-heptose 1,7-bisphosphate phosphatase
MSKAIFFDRDGVINIAPIVNGLPGSPNRFTDFKIINGVDEIIKELKNNNWLIFVITNQPDISRGKLPVEEVDAMHQYLSTSLQIDDIIVCPHIDSNNCSCRKPKPGMIFELQKKYGIDLSSSFMVGDRWKDIAAGHAAGCKTIFIDYGYSETPPDYQTYTVKNLYEASRRIINNA